MADTRIYKVTSSAEKGAQLIRATSQAAVRSHLTRLFSIELATPEQVAELYENGTKVQDATNGEAK